MKYLEKGIHDHFSNLQRAQGDTSSASNTDGSSRIQSNLIGNSSSEAAMFGPPFAIVNSVAAASPADQAGLKAGDKIRSFGIINWINHERLSKVAELVQQNEGVSLNSFSFCLLFTYIWEWFCRLRQKTSFTND